MIHSTKSVNVNSTSTISRRRQNELAAIRCTIPAGPWDADCEAWPELSYKWDLGAGFKAQVYRVPRDSLLGNFDKGWTWASAIVRPLWYPIGWNWSPDIYSLGTHYYSETNPRFLPPGPIKNLRHDWHTGLLVCQHDNPLRDMQPQTGIVGKRQRYTTFERARDEVYLLVGHLVSLLFTHQEILLNEDQPSYSSPDQRKGFKKAFAEHYEALLTIREIEMRTYLRLKPQLEKEAENEAIWALEDELARQVAKEAACVAAEEAKKLVEKKKAAYKKIREASLNAAILEHYQDVLKRELADDALTKEQLDGLLDDYALASDFPVFSQKYLKAYQQLLRYKSFLLEAKRAGHYNPSQARRDIKKRERIEKEKKEAIEMADALARAKAGTLTMGTAKNAIERDACFKHLVEKKE